MIKLNVYQILNNILLNKYSDQWLNRENDEKID